MFDCIEEKKVKGDSVNYLRASGAAVAAQENATASPVNKRKRRGREVMVHLSTAIGISSRFLWCGVSV